MRAHAEQAKQNQASGRAIQRATKNTPGKQKTEAKQIKQAKQAQVSKHTSKANQQGPRKNNARRTAWRHKGPPHAHEGINPSLGQFLRSSIFSPKLILQHFRTSFCPGDGESGTYLLRTGQITLQHQSRTISLFSRCAVAGNHEQHLSDPTRSKMITISERNKKNEYTTR